jgi:hypothetical protein
MTQFLFIFHLHAFPQSLTPNHKYQSPPPLCRDTHLGVPRESQEGARAQLLRSWRKKCVSCGEYFIKVYSNFSRGVVTWRYEAISLRSHLGVFNKSLALPASNGESRTICMNTESLKGIHGWALGTYLILHSAEQKQPSRASLLRLYVCGTVRRARSHMSRECE